MRRPTTRHASVGCAWATAATWRDGGSGRRLEGGRPHVTAARAQPHRGPTHHRPPPSSPPYTRGLRSLHARLASHPIPPSTCIHWRRTQRPKAAVSTLLLPSDSAVGAVGIKSMWAWCMSISVREEGGALVSAGGGGGGTRRGGGAVVDGGSAVRCPIQLPSRDRSVALNANAA